MKLRWRLLILLATLSLLPALPALWLTNNLLDRSLAITLDAPLDAALEAGLRQSGERYRTWRSDQQRRLDLWAEPSADRRPEGFNPNDLLFHRANAGGAAGADSAAWAGEFPSAASLEHSPPQWVHTSREWKGGVLHWLSPLSTQWQEDAEKLSSSRRSLAVLQAGREDLQRSLWLSFAAIYAAALLLALIAAWFLSRGILGPVHQLEVASAAVARGERDLDLPIGRKDELGRLAETFAGMVDTLDAQSRRLIELEKMEGWREMARTLAHEIKNPLTPIQLTVEEMRERYKGDDVAYRDLLVECSRIVIEEVESLRRVVSRFREFSRPVEPHLQTVELEPLLRDLSLLQADLECALELEPLQIQADPDRLRQLVMNLCENSRQAGATSLRLHNRREGKWAVIELQDNGPGIPSAELESIFEPYRSGHKGGLGLGLALARGIALAHGGDLIAFESPGQGAKFRLRIPLEHS